MSIVLWSLPQREKLSSALLVTSAALAYALCVSLTHAQHNLCDYEFAFLQIFINVIFLPIIIISETWNGRFTWFINAILQQTSKKSRGRQKAAITGTDLEAITRQEMRWLDPDKVVESKRLCQNCPQSINGEFSPPQNVLLSLPFPLYKQCNSQHKTIVLTIGTTTAIKPCKGNYCFSFLWASSSWPQ